MYQIYVPRDYTCPCMTVIHILYVNVGQPKDTDDTSKPSEYIGRTGTRGHDGRHVGDSRHGTIRDANVV